MNCQHSKNEELKELLDDFLQIHYNGSFLQMVCEYIRITGMQKKRDTEIVGYNESNDKKGLNVGFLSRELIWIYTCCAEKGGSLILEGAEKVPLIKMPLYRN